MVDAQKCSEFIHVFWSSLFLLDSGSSKLNTRCLSGVYKQQTRAIRLAYFSNLLCIAHDFHSNTCAVIRIVSFRQECSNICIDIPWRTLKKKICRCEQCAALMYVLHAISCILGQFYVHYDNDVYLNLCFFRSFYQFIGSYAALCYVSRCLVFRLAFACIFPWHGTMSILSRACLWFFPLKFWAFDAWVFVCIKMIIGL